MTHLIKMVPNHVWNLDGSKLEAVPAASERRSYRHQLEIPHFLNSNPNLGMVTAGHVSMIIPSDMDLQVGDHIENEYGWKAMITAVTDLRPAAGDWGDRKVNFVQVQYL